MAALCLLIVLRRRIRELREMEKKRKLRIKRRALREDDPFEVMPEKQFQELYRFPKYICREVVDFIVPHMRKRKRTSGILEERKVLCAIRFFAVGCYQRPIGQDWLIAMSQSSVSRCVHEVAKILSDKLADNFIKFPTSHAEIREIQEEFEQIDGFPGIIGCVDCTHISIKGPEKYREHVYYSVRKTAHTKNVQIICDANLRILNVNARYGGTAHDSFIWRNSAVSRHLEQANQRGRRNCWLLGDSGYSQLPWLMTPILNPENPAQQRYNAKHKNTRDIVECCIGVLKSRFRCLSKQRVLMYSPEKAGTIINACVVLHNIMINQGIPLPSEQEINEAILDEENEDDDRYSPDQEIVNEDIVSSLLEQGRLIRLGILNVLN